MRYSILSVVCLFAMKAAALLFAQVDGSNTEVPASIRLRDYVKSSEYPPEIRVLQEGDEALSSVPTIPGDARQTAQILDFSGERLRAGSLEVFAKIRVAVAGEYSFRTDLQDTAGKALRVIITVQLRTGEQKVRFIFFGRAIRRTLRAGAFQLPGILGEKLSAADGLGGALEYFSAPYKTQRYKKEQFSDAVWDAPEKRAKIRALKREMATGH